ncbi:hypothetical protein WG899_00055 [Paucibacter sp. AS339]|uniref:hypothetical protein n=1 Tax=Paucibacter hankyongi TaxID=3133434 RepID=UPI00309CA7EC
MQAWRSMVTLLFLLLNAGAQAAEPPHKPAVNLPTGATCPSLPDGGAAPPDFLSTEDAETLRRLLRTYRSASLDAKGARALKQSLCDAGLWQQPAVQRALAEAGFSAKQINRLAPTLAPEPAAAATSAPASAPRLPRRE